MTKWDLLLEWQDGSIHEHQSNAIYHIYGMIDMEEMQLLLTDTEDAFAKILQ